MSSKKSLKQRDSFEGRLIEAFGGKSLQTIASELGEVYSSFWNWVKGRTGIPPQVLAKIGNHTGHSINWLLTGRGDPLTVEHKKYSEEELAILVSNLRYGGFFTIEAFIFHLARINHQFRDMLTPDARENAEQVVKGFEDVAEAFAELHEPLVDDIGGEVGPIEPAEMILAPVVARIEPARKPAISTDLVTEEQTIEMERRLTTRKRKTG